MKSIYKLNQDQAFLVIKNKLNSQVFEFKEFDMDLHRSSVILRGSLDKLHLQGRKYNKLLKLIKRVTK